jgi:hypothetical protein
VAPLDHDRLGRSDTGDYDWCQGCGPIDSDEVLSRARTCAKGKDCYLRESLSDDEFDDDGGGDGEL